MCAEASHAVFRGLMIGLDCSTNMGEPLGCGGPRFVPPMSPSSLSDDRDAAVSGRHYVKDLRTT